MITGLFLQRPPWLCLLLLLLLTSSSSARQAAGGTVDIGFQFAWEDGPLLLDSLRYPSVNGQISITRLSGLVAGLALERPDGTWAEFPDSVAWIDAAQHRTRWTVPAVAPGDYRAMRFFVGPAAGVNTGDPAKWPAGHPLNPDVSGLHWSWQGGYIFLALEGMLQQGGGETGGWSWHFARDPNRTAVTVPLTLAMKPGAVAAVDLQLDLATLLRGLSPLRDGTSTHSREGDPIASSLRTALPGAFRVTGIRGGAAEPPVVPVKPLYLPEVCTPWRFRVPRGFPVPALPRDNPLLTERVSLGHRLFSDTRLSRTGTVSCASCHDESRAFSDPRPVSLGVEGRAGTRNAMSLTNLAWKSSFFWDGRSPSLRDQALQPIQDHAEMDASLDLAVAALGRDPDMVAGFAAAFQPAEITAEKIALALENYLLTLTSAGARIDRVLQGTSTFTDEEQRGFTLFFTEYDPRTRQTGADCFHCHGGASFTDHQFHNNGLGDTKDRGLAGRTGQAADEGKFAVPSLRNVALTAPYMHDGRFATLEEVIGHYTSGVQRSPTLDPNLAKHPGGGIPLSSEDKQALVAFLRTLTAEP